MAMNAKKYRDSILLTPAQAVEAVCLDFCHYEPQLLLFAEILRLLSNNDMVVQRERGRNGIWVSQPGQRRMRWLEGSELVRFLCEVLRQRKLEPPLLAAICARVFQTRAVSEGDAATGQITIRIFTGIEDFQCRQCGRCCRTLDYRSEITAEDVALWKRLGRKDILEWVGVFHKEDESPVFRIWMKPGTREFAESCPFLVKLEAEDLRWICRIHDVKPQICRQYPVSRKHATMTGCPGFRPVRN